MCHPPPNVNSSLSWPEPNIRVCAFLPLTSGIPFSPARNFVATLPIPLQGPAIYDSETLTKDFHNAGPRVPFRNFTHTE